MIRMIRSDRQCDPITLIVAHHVALAYAPKGGGAGSHGVLAANTLWVTGYVTVPGGVAFRPI
jgi:hypothetical protein